MSKIDLLYREQKRFRQRKTRQGKENEKKRLIKWR